MAIRSLGNLQYEMSSILVNFHFCWNSNCRRMIIIKLTMGELYEVEIDNQENCNFTNW